MLTFIGTILLVYLIWLIVKPLLLSYVHRKYTRKINEMFGQAFGQSPYGHASNGANRASDGGRKGFARHSTPQRKRKIFSREDGEYVEFEEIEAKAEFRHTSPQTDGSKASYTPREPQVSDADWEDVR